MLKGLLSQIYEPFGEKGIVEDALDGISKLQQRTRYEPTPGLELLRSIVQNLALSSRAKQGYRAERTRYEDGPQFRRNAYENQYDMLGSKVDPLKQYRKEMKMLFRILQRSSLKDDKAVGEEYAQCDHLVALGMEYLRVEGISADSSTADLQKELTQGHLRGDEEREIYRREVPFDAWSAGVEGAHKDTFGARIEIMEQKGFSLTDPFREVLN
jgi:hypothetical protein